MNRSGHAVAGAIVGGLGYLVTCEVANDEPELGAFLLSVAAGAAVACVHDLLEPAIHPNHRSVIHSVVFNAAGVAGLRQLWQRNDIEPAQKLVLVSLGLACLTHPVLDAMSPKGLPLLG